MNTDLIFLPIYANVSLIYKITGGEKMVRCCLARILGKISS